MLLTRPISFARLNLVHVPNGARIFRVAWFEIPNAGIRIRIKIGPFVLTMILVVCVRCCCRFTSLIRSCIEAQGGGEKVN